MRSILLKFAWFVGVPGAGIVSSLHIFYPKVLEGQFVDTTPATVARIRPGMTVDEVSSLVGKPPGEYIQYRTPMFRFRSGNTWSHVVEWSSPGGSIEVVDGRYGIRADKNNTIEDWREIDRVVRSVRWSPVNPASGP